MSQEPTTAPQHHPVFSHFRPYTGELPPNCELDFLGTLAPLEFIEGLVSVPKYASRVENYYALIDDEYFEWIDLLESIVAASGTYTMIDLGAG